MTKTEQFPAHPVSLVRHLRLADISSLARYLMTYNPVLRARVAETMFQRAMIAAAHADAWNEHHPTFGDGTLQDAIRRAVEETGRDLPPELSFSDPDYLNSWIDAIQAARFVGQAQARITPPAVAIAAYREGAVA